MMRRLIGMLRTLRTLVDRHGGGLEGSCVVAARAWKMARVLGVKGVLRRFRDVGQALHQAPPPSGFQFPAPAPLTDQPLRVGIMAHVFYADLVEELAEHLRLMPINYTLLVSVVNGEAAAACRASFDTLPHLDRLDIRIIPNRGRDIAPFFVDFRDDIRALDIIAHVHTKKSLYTGSEQSNWRTYLIKSLLGTKDRITWVLGMFLSEPRLGIVYPETYGALPIWAHTWLGNLTKGRDLAHAMSLEIEPHRYFDYPAGSMFWARVTALSPILDLGLTTDNFPVEQGQTDGTMQHAIERTLVLAARQAGFIAGVLPANGALSLTDEGARNWPAYFQESFDTRLQVGALRARIISVDLFDTLVTRPFLYPSGARAYLSSLALTRLGIMDFARHREHAERFARQRTGRDVDLDDIYAAMQGLNNGLDADAIASLKALELDTEARTLQARAQVLGSIAMLRERGHDVIAVSDMYLDLDQLARVLPAPVQELPRRCHVSCVTQLRKDDGRAWSALPEIEGVPPDQWLHVGDNERADIQLPHDLGYLMPLHVLRPDAFLDVVPALRPLRPPLGASTRWQDQLMLGLVTRRLADIADREPQRFADGLALADPHELGYLVLGPLLIDYTCWLARLALELDARQVLFLAREGHLLERAFNLVRQASGDAIQVQTAYLLASRRGVGLASIIAAEDLDSLLGNTFQGTLQQLLESRMGSDAAMVVQKDLGARAMQEPVFLPDMRQALQTRLAPAMPGLLAVAEAERSHYLEYWNATTADGSLLLADIGYSGTIQRLLSRLTGRDMDGAYFALSARASALDDSGNRAWGRYEDGRGMTPERSQVCRHDLLLETLLTAPQGQFLKFTRDENGTLASEHAAHELDAAGLRHIQEIHSGALAYVAHICEIAQGDTFRLEFDAQLVQVPLKCLGEGLWKAGSWLDSLQIHDAYTGRGSVRATARTH